MLDGIYLETAGLPTAVICTEPFEDNARVYADINGFSGYRFAVIEHPVGNRDQAGLRRLAESSMPQILSILSRPDRQKSSADCGQG